MLTSFQLLSGDSQRIPSNQIYSVLDQSFPEIRPLKIGIPFPVDLVRFFFLDDNPRTDHFFLPSLDMIPPDLLY